MGKMKATKLTDHFHVEKAGNVETRGSKRRKEQKDEPDPPAQTSASKEVEELDFLKQFDLQWEYGPCTGVTRLERWERATNHGLSPPDRVKELVEAHTDDDKYTQCLWSNYTL